VETTGYSAREVAGLLGLSVAQVRSYVRRGLLTPTREQRQLRFSFQDVVLLRAAKGLKSARIASARIQRALRMLRAQLPEGRPLTAVAIAADGNRIVVRDGGTRWNPESGQALFDFSVRELLAQVAPLRDLPVEASDWFARGCAREDGGDAAGAKEAYRRALALDVEHADAHINLGRLLHEAGRVEDARAHYEWALAARSGDKTAQFNLGVALEDLRRRDEAILAYRAVLKLDRRHADAHYNLARLLEQAGQIEAAARHLIAYRVLTRAD